MISRLSLIGAATLAAAVLAVVPASAATPVNGQLLFVSNPGEGQNRLGTMDPDGSGFDLLPELPDTMGSPGTPAWSPDGTRVAFSAFQVNANGDGGLQKIFVMNVDGTGLKAITDGKAETGSLSWDYAPTWSPDGKQIAYHADRDNSTASGGDRIWRVSVDGGGEPVAVTGSGTPAWHANWGPNGEIAFMRYDRWYYEWIIAAIKPDGTDQRDIVVATSSTQHDWSPDGSRIAFNKVADRQEEIFTVAAAGGDLKRLTTDVPCLEWSETNEEQCTKPGPSDQHPTWSPAGDLIAFSRGYDKIAAVSPAGGGIIELGKASPNSDSEPDWGTRTGGGTTNGGPTCFPASAETQRGKAIKVALACADPNGDKVARTIVGHPSNGSLGAIDNSAGTVTYTPKAGFTGTDKLTFKGSDGTLESASVAVDLKVVAPPVPPPPPLPGPGGNQTGGGSTGGGSGSGGGNPSTGGGSTCVGSGCTVQITCPNGAPLPTCDGDISNGGGRPRAFVASAAAKAKSTALFGRTSFRVPRGKAVKVKVKLTKHGRALLRKRKTIKTSVIVRFRGADGRYTSTVKPLTLRAAKATKKKRR